MNYLASLPYALLALLSLVAVPVLLLRREWGAVARSLFVSFFSVGLVGALFGERDPYHKDVVMLAGLHFIVGLWSLWTASRLTPQNLSASPEDLEREFVRVGKLANFARVQALLLASPAYLSVFYLFYVMGHFETTPYGVDVDATFESFRYLAVLLIAASTFLFRKRKRLAHYRNFLPASNRSAPLPSVEKAPTLEKQRFGEFSVIGLILLSFAAVVYPWPYFVVALLTFSLLSFADAWVTWFKASRPLSLVEVYGDDAENQLARVHLFTKPTQRYLYYTVLLTLLAAAPLAQALADLT